MRKFYTILFFLIIGCFANSQKLILSETSEISILTIGPGAQLYDSFGHSAYRVKDKTLGIDIAYNYGVFDFNTPNFYTKFAQGKLLYKLDKGDYLPFFKHYVRQDRWVKEQVLDLSVSEKQAMFDFLQNNAKPENRDYLYDFFYDNCATKIRDVMVEVLGDDLNYHDNFDSEDFSFRGLIQKNVQANTWGSLGMDIAIGSVVDRKATAWQYQFLPEYIFKSNASATVTRNKSKQNLVQKTNTLFENTGVKAKNNFFLSPLFIFGILGILILYITFRDYINNTRSRFLDAFTFLITGTIGVILLLLWFATDHSSTANNYNLLWAFPFSLLFIFTISKKYPKKWIRKYIFFLLAMLFLLFIHWVTGVQKFTIGLIPIFIALGVRYLFLLKFLKLQQK